jgi:hypothetical protein
MWTMAAVLAAVVGSAIVAWQAWETHRTTSLSQKALDASAALAIDSARSRLDQDAPRIDVYVEGVDPYYWSWTCPALRSSLARDGT